MAQRPLDKLSFWRGKKRLNLEKNLVLLRILMLVIIRNNICDLSKGRFRLYVRKNLFHNRVIHVGNSLTFNAVSHLL